MRRSSSARGPPAAHKLTGESERGLSHRAPRLDCAQRRRHTSASLTLYDHRIKGPRQVRAVLIDTPYLHGMATVSDRVEERRRAVRLARRYRDAEGRSIAQIAQRLGRSPATIKAYFYDPTGEKARAVKARYQGVCRGCGAPTQPRNGKGDAYAYCKKCRPGAIAPRWTHERVREAMRAWRERYGELPSSYDWSRTHARRRGAQALARLAEGVWPSPATVTDLYGTWAAAHADASQPGPPRRS
jgi:AraC-like DNA-binding protein